MDKQNVCTTETTFVRRVTVCSLILALLLLGLLGVMWQNRDSLYSFSAARQAARGRYENALNTAEKIGREELRLQCRYEIGEEMYQSQAFQEAEALFSQLGSFSDSPQMRLLCAYALADSRYQAGDYEAALTGFASLGDYSDSVQRQQQTIYATAAQAQSQGDLSAALRLYLSIADYEDSYNRAFEAALSITGDRTVAESMLESGGQTQEALEKILKITQRRSLFPEARVDAGAYHTVFLRSDGTVAAAGDNRYGQCDVSSWKNIIQICAGAYHTVGLRSDGTVVATGRNDQGQCSVEDLSGIVQIAAGDSDTYALTKEGQVLMRGFHSYEPITRAAQVESIYAGSYGAAAVTRTGTLIPSHSSYAGKPTGELLSLGLHTGYLLTHYLDGTLSSSFDLGGDWKDIVWFDAGPTAIIAADLEGRVRSHFFREGDALDFSSLEDISQCAAGTAHFVFLTAGGTLIALGDNTYGQCNVDSLYS